MKVGSEKMISIAEIASHFSDRVQYISDNSPNEESSGLMLSIEITKLYVSLLSVLTMKSAQHTEGAITIKADRIITKAEIDEVFSALVDDALPLDSVVRLCEKG